eukprot:jgi/Chlat1/4294/Chrsp29S04381
MAAPESECPLLDLPDELIWQILRKSDGRSVAACAASCRRLCSVAADEPLWQALALDRWKVCRVELFDGSYQELYKERASVPLTFDMMLARLHSLRCAAAEHLDTTVAPEVPLGYFDGIAPDSEATQAGLYGSKEIVEAMMMTLFNIGLFINRQPSLQHTNSYSRGAQADCLWWWRAGYQGIARFIGATGGLLAHYDLWRGGFVHWPCVPWRRSAIQFFLEACGSEPDASLHNSLLVAVSRLDAGLLSAAPDLQDVVTKAPQGIPAAHWWFFPAHKRHREFQPLRWQV